MPAGIVLFAAIATGTSIAVMAGVTTPPPSGEAAAFAGGFAATDFFRGFAIIFVSWLLYAGVFRAISLLFRGDGSFKRCLEFVGYGFIPAIFAAAIELATIMVAYPKIDLASVDPGLMMQTLLQDPLMQVSDIAGVLLLMWSAIIWIFGVKHAYNLSRRTATVVVVLPVAVYLLYSTVIII
jgi:hypothetical protein